MDAFAGEFHQHDLGVEVSVLRAEGGDHLLHGVVHAVHARDGLDETLGQSAEVPAEHVARHVAEDGDQHDDDGGGEDVPDDAQARLFTQRTGQKEEQVIAEAAADYFEHQEEHPAGHQERRQ